MEANGVVKGLVAGALIGAVLGILYAPKTGRQTRKEICRATDDFLENVKDRLNQSIMKIEQMAGR